VRKLALVIPLLTMVGIAFADDIWVNDKGVLIPVDTDKAPIQAISHGDGTQTWVYDHGNQVDIVHPDGTTTSTYGYGD
jgi:hypothetical protein